MSRSRKRTPYCGDKKNKIAKRMANKKVRQKLKSPEFTINGKQYKRVFQSWDICDYLELLNHTIVIRLRNGSCGAIDTRTSLVETNYGNVIVRYMFGSKAVS